MCSRPCPVRNHDAAGVSGRAALKNRHNGIRHRTHAAARPSLRSSPLRKLRGRIASRAGAGRELSTIRACNPVGSKL